MSQFSFRLRKTQARSNFFLESGQGIIGLRLARFDWWLFGAVALLIVLGSMTILSTILEPGVTLFKNSLFVSHLLNITIGISVFLIFVRLDYKILRHFAWVLYILTIALLILVLVIGYTTRGSMRWIDFGFFNFQPSEISKILLIIFFAAFFSGLKDKIKKLIYVIFSFILILIPTVLVLLEPDLGTGVVFIVIWLGMLVLAGVQWKHLMLFFLLGTIALPFFWFFALAPYQKDRIEVFLNPKSYPSTKGYAVIQSMIAVGSGKFLGRGWGRGTQSHLQFLPERHTDFIFASLAEELGFVGVSILLLGFFLLLLRILKTIQHASDAFGSLVGVGIFMYFIFQIIINIGMNLGIMPITGIPLPLISYGGTSLLTCFVALGLVESIAIHRTSEIIEGIDRDD